MHKLTVYSSFVLFACAVGGCGTGDARVSTATGPSTASVEALTLSVDPPTADQKVKTTFNFCPAVSSVSTVSPFFVPVNLVVLSNGTDVLVVSQITVNFTDTSGVPMPQVTLPAPQLTTQFGTALVQARSSTTFPLLVDIGCHVQHQGIMRIGVDATDSRGRQSSGHINFPVR
jgi:hypothetical protein